MMVFVKILWEFSEENVRKDVLDFGMLEEILERDLELFRIEGYSLEVLVAYIQGGRSVYC